MQENTSPAQIASVVVDKALYSFDMEFDYLVPDGVTVFRGQRVAVSFGKAEKKRIGVVTKVRTDIPSRRLKSISAVLDSADDIILNDELLGLMYYIKENTFCTYFDAVKTLLPGGLALRVTEKYSLNPTVGSDIDSLMLTEQEKTALAGLMGLKTARELNDTLEYGFTGAKANIKKSLIQKGALIKSELVRRQTGDLTEKTIRLTPAYLSKEISENIDNGKQKPLTSKQKAVVSFLEEADTATEKEICYNCCVTSAVINKLIKLNICEQFQNIISRSITENAEAVKDINSIILSDQQKQAFIGIDALMSDTKPHCALLQGVTGSGKTTVFLKLIDKALQSGKTAMMLVPEISLTPQMLKSFSDIFGSKIAVLHSSLTMGQRIDEYKRIKDGSAKVVIGTRSAVFAPLVNIGIIIIDEEGEHTYKSEKAPRYHARNIAKQRCFYHNALLLLASATPSLDTAYNAEIGRYSRFRLTERYSRAVLPEVYIVDMKAEHELGNRGNFSSVLIDELRENLSRGEQSMLLINRRGYHTYMNCIKCGYVYSCPNCNIPLTYHKPNNSLICHYCGYTERFTGKCKSCGSPFIYSSGTGTQRIEDELAQKLPTARILRMDADTTVNGEAYEKSFEAFRNHEYDIMVGTQMIAKGLDFENVTLVGVLQIDKSLYAGDYLGYENTFSLVTQVVGRCGRGSKKGRAYIQTFTPEHYVLNLAAAQDYDEFYRQETEIRKTLLFPPFCDICVIGFSAVEEKLCEKGAMAFLGLLTEGLEKIDIPIRVLGPSKAVNARINGKYRYRLIIKCKNNKLFREFISYTLLKAYQCKDLERVSFYADLNGEII